VSHHRFGGKLDEKNGRGHVIFGWRHRAFEKNYKG